MEVIAESMRKTATAMLYPWKVALCMMVELGGKTARPMLYPHDCRVKKDDGETDDTSLESCTLHDGGARREKRRGRRYIPRKVQTV
jgi:hypothetical protein